MMALLTWFATLTSLVFVTIGGRFGVYYMLFMRPIIDASWATSFTVGLKVTGGRIFGTLIPFILLPKIIFSRKTNFFKLPLSKIALLFILSNFSGFAIVAIQGNYYTGIEYVLRVLNGFLAFFLYQFYFNDKDSFRKLLLVLLLSGIFPLGTGLYSALTGHVFFRMESTSGGLLRTIGVYHDVVTQRLYAFQSLAVALLFWAYFRPKNVFKKLLLIGYGLVSCYLIYRCYSKAGMVIFASWCIIWPLFNRKIFLAILVPVAFVLVNLYSGGTMVEDLSKVYLAEIDALGGNENAPILAGRLAGWESLLEVFQNAPLVNKMFGVRNVMSAHNDFLRMLLTNGVFGFLLYLLLYGFAGIIVLRNILFRVNALNVMGGMLYIMWLVDSMGATTGMYPSYQWFTWGIITLSLRGVEGLHQQSETGKRP